MLHVPPARRSAANPRIPRRNRTSGCRRRLSVTLGDLPPGRVLACYKVAPDHWLLIVGCGYTWGEIIRAYISGDIPGWVVDRMFCLYGTVSPAVNPTRYYQDRWWCEEWVVDTNAVYTAEEMARDQGGELITPWDHDWLDELDLPTLNV